MDEDKFYEKLRKQLEEGFEWPSVYLFKFIVPADNQKVAQVQNLFNAEVAQITQRESKNGKFISVSIKEMMMSPDSIIEIYREASKIEGIISL